MSVRQKKTTTPSSGSGGTPVDCTKVPCPLECKLVSITVIGDPHANQRHRSQELGDGREGQRRRGRRATSLPSSEACWKAISWSGDSGSPGDKPNQRKLSRAASKKFHIEAALGGVKDSLDVWVLWATVTNLTGGTTPANAVQYGARYDGTENLGARSYDAGNSAVGKVVPVATITPAGVDAVVRGRMDLQTREDAARFSGRSEGSKSLGHGLAGRHFGRLVSKADPGCQ